MATIHQLGFALFLIVCASVQVSFATTTHCWRQKCTECAETSNVDLGEQVKCDLRDLVTPAWLDVPIENPAYGTSDKGVEFYCIKMVASDNTIVGASTDVIRGCTLKYAAENICVALVNAEQGQGKMNGKCNFCDGDYCNGAAGIQLSLLALIVSMLLAKFVYH